MNLLKHIEPRLGSGFDGLHSELVSLMMKELAKGGNVDRVMVPALDELHWTRSHQSLVAVELAFNIPFEHYERVSRFVTSLNDINTMKADVVTATDGLLYEGIVITGWDPGGVSNERLNALAKRAGYNQLIKHTYTGEK